jgi:hypothetical protein
MEVIVSGSDDWTKIEDTAGPTLQIEGGAPSVFF